MQSTTKCSTNHGDAAIIPEESRYEYEPLTANDSIRVLLLQPGPFEDLTINASLEIVSLSDKPIYSPLSYSWAKEGGCACLLETLAIDGTLVPITSNLHDGLRRIRSTDNVQRLWIDAVCIDQRNHDERSWQVSIMADIYRHGESTIIWLGETSDEDGDMEASSVLLSSFFASMDKKEQRFLEFPDMFHNIACLRYQSTTNESATSPGRCDYHCICNALPPDGSKIPDSFLDRLSDLIANPSMCARAVQNCKMFSIFFCRRYWTRRWMVQEICSSDYLRFYWGSCVWALQHSSTLHNVARMLYQVGDIVRALLERSQSEMKLSRHQRDLLGAFDLLSTRAQDVSRLVRFLPERWNYLRNSGEPALMRLLHQYSTTECSDPRDRLYALSSLAVSLDTAKRIEHAPGDSSPVSLSRFEIIPNYSLSVQEVCLDFAHKLIDAGFAMALFRNASLVAGADKPQNQDLPTWVPDLRERFSGDDIYTSNPSSHILHASAKIMTCRLYLLGRVASSVWTEDDAILLWEISWDPHVALPGNPRQAPRDQNTPSLHQSTSYLRSHKASRRTRSFQIDPRQLESYNGYPVHEHPIQSGDLLCVDQADVSFFHSQKPLVDESSRPDSRKQLLIVLRRAGDGINQYQIVTVLPSTWFAPASRRKNIYGTVDERRVRRKFGSSEEIVVDII